MPHQWREIVNFRQGFLLYSTERRTRHSVLSSHHLLYRIRNNVISHFRRKLAMAAGRNDNELLAV